MTDAVHTPGKIEHFHRPQGAGITGHTDADFLVPVSLDSDRRFAVADYAIARCLTSLDGYDPVAERKANARRLSACWNALEGISTADIEAGVIAELVEAANRFVNGPFPRGEKEFADALEGLRNALAKIGGAS